MEWFEHMDVTMHVAMMSILACYVAYLALWVWKREKLIGLLSFTVGAIGSVGGLAILGFAAGFFGPIILAPSSNQGPLLGIFFTGPGGAIVGAIIYVLFVAAKAGKQPNK